MFWLPEGLGVCGLLFSDLYFIIFIFLYGFSPYYSGDFIALYSLNVFKALLLFLILLLLSALYSNCAGVIVSSTPLFGAKD